MYKMDLALNNLQWLICHKTKPNHFAPLFTHSWRENREIHIVSKSISVKWNTTSSRIWTQVVSSIFNENYSSKNDSNFSDVTSGIFVRFWTEPSWIVLYWNFVFILSILLPSDTNTNQHFFKTDLSPLALVFQASIFSVSSFGIDLVNSWNEINSAARTSIFRDQVSWLFCFMVYQPFLGPLTLN